MFGFTRKNTTVMVQSHKPTGHNYIQYNMNDDAYIHCDTMKCKHEARFTLFVNGRMIGSYCPACLDAFTPAYNDGVNDIHITSLY